MRDIRVRPFKEEDEKQLRLWQHENFGFKLETPWGFAAPGVETAVGEKDGAMVGSLTASVGIVLDPAIIDPEANELDVIGVLLKQEAALSYSGASQGAVAAYVITPDEEKNAGWIKILEKVGYSRAAEGCVILRRMLRKPTERSIKELRAEAIAESNFDEK